MTDVVLRRRFYAEEIEATANLTSAAVVEALATVPRERFLPPGPWTIRGEGNFLSGPRQTTDDDPRHVYHNVAVGIDPGRMLFNGAPSVIAMAIDALGLKPGACVLHLGTGLGYYTALIASCVGPSGRVLGIEVDAELAARAGQNLADCPGVEVRQGNGTEPLTDRFDAILINAGVTRPLPSWLEALAPEGRMVLPITATMGMTTIGKGPLVAIARKEDPEKLSAKVIGFVAIYSAIGLRDDDTNRLLVQALTRSPFPTINSARLDAHAPDASCWLHAPGVCLSAAQ
jgi:protein-L-isoaspartate(D-aspartate) O-methyltransferase